MIQSEETLPPLTKKNISNLGKNLNCWILWMCQNKHTLNWLKLYQNVKFMTPQYINTEYAYFLLDNCHFITMNGCEIYHPGPLSLHGLTQIRAGNNTSGFMWGVAIHLCPNFMLGMDK